MDKYTYTDESVIKNLETNYYLVRFNAEQKEDIVYKEKVFKFKTEYKANELAVSLLNGQMSYPSTVFLDENMNMLTVVPGYLTPKDINPILKYFGENIYRVKNWKEYESEL
jgi:thioredoxin-related protein